MTNFFNFMPSKNTFFYVGILMIFKALNSMGQPSSFENKTYLSNIKTVQLYPDLNNRASALSPPIVPLGRSQLLKLSFDDLSDNGDDYYVKFYHCNFDWQPSQLSPVEYLDQYNEFNIIDFEYSFNTKVPYIHYWYSLPRLKKSGNYLLVVYRNGDEDDLVLTKRLVVYEDLAMIGLKPEAAYGSEAGAQWQQVQFTINYGKINLEYPIQNVKVALRQNYRWDDAKYSLKPVFVKEFQKMLEYQFFDLENAFRGGNEFRFFNHTRLGSGLGLEHVERKADRDEVFLTADKPRKGRAYNSQRVNRDLNGQFLIENADVSHPETESDYALVHFFLESESPYPHPVYVLGSFDLWQTTKANQLVFNKEKSRYEGDFLLKQGRYDYTYATQSAENEVTAYPIEGTYMQTENEYDLIVYYRSPGSRADRVIGYAAVRFQE